MKKIYAAQIINLLRNIFPRSVFLSSAMVVLTACSSLSSSLFLSPLTPTPNPTSTLKRSPASQEDISADPSEIALLSDASLYSIQPEFSVIQIYAFRSGPGARFGHNHVLRLKQGKGTVLMPQQGIKGAKADFSFRLDALEIDPPELRADLGGSFKQPLKESDIEGTREHMLGLSGLDAASFPEVRIQGVVQSGEEPVAIARVSLKLHGVSRDQYTLIRFSKQDQRLRAQGQLLVRHQDFGLKPYSVLGGLLAVDDWIAIEFDIHASADGRE